MTTKVPTTQGITQETYPYAVQNRIYLHADDQTAKELFNRTLGPIAGTTLTIAGFIGTTEINYREYHKWLKQYQDTEVMGGFEKLHYDHPSLQEFLDPQTQKVMLDPVRTPFNEVYERSTIKILSHLRKDGTILDRSSKFAFGSDQIEDAPEVLAKLKATYTLLLEEELPIDHLIEVKEGLQMLVRDLKKQVNNYVIKEILVLTDQLKSELITIAEFAEKCTALNKKMNPTVHLKQPING
jgi:hypothetical protein